MPDEVVATCVWRATPELLLALDRRFGEPVDSYVNGAQVWLRDDGPNDARLEWRLHPVARFRLPDGLSHYDLWPTTVLALANGDPPPAPLERLWEGLEAFAGFGDEVEPVPLAAACAAAVGIEPDAFGIVDHDAVGDQWERSGGTGSIVAALLEQLSR
jgi:hypothetical protein